MGLGRRRLWVLAALAALAPSSLFAEASSGKLAPRIELDGASPDGACTFVAESKEHTYESATGSPIDVPAGEYLLRVECKDGDSALIPATTPIQISAGRTAAPKIEIKTARVRVEARRNGIMLPAKVKLFAAGQGSDKKPLAEIPANQKASVAQGRYDVLVELDDPKSPRAEVLLEKTAVAGGPLTVLQADLSDGGLIVAATANGKKASALVRVFRGKGAERDVGQAEAGEEVRLPAGRYLASTELRDSADFATKKREIWIRAGKVLRVAEAFETGLLSVTVERDHKPVPATVRVSLPGAGDFFNHFSAPGTITVSPGAYEVSIESDALGPLKPPSKSGVRVTKSQNTRVGFDLTPGTLVVKVVKAGKPIDAEIHVRAAGGGEEIATDVGGKFRLWPGRYEVSAKLEDGDEVLDGPFEVKLGEKVARTINVVRGTLTVLATRGESNASDAEIMIFKPGAAKPLVKGRSGAKLEIAPGTYDIKVVSGAEVVWRESVKLKTQQVLRIPLTAKHGKEEALPEGDLSAPPDDLPEGEEPAAKEELRMDAGLRDGGVPEASVPREVRPDAGPGDGAPVPLGARG